MKDLYIKHIAGIMGLKSWQVENCIEMLGNGDTIPFISRYRKEKTGGMDDAQVAELKHLADVCTELEKRKETILKTIGAKLKTFIFPSARNAAPAPPPQRSWASSRLPT